MKTHREPSRRSSARRLLIEAGVLRNRIGSVFNRAQLGPSNEIEWRRFNPGR